MFREYIVVSGGNEVDFIVFFLAGIYPLLKKKVLKYHNQH